MKRTTKKRQWTELYMLDTVGVCSSTNEIAANTAVSTMNSATNELMIGDGGVNRAAQSFDANSWVRFILRGRRRRETALSKGHPLV